MKIRLNFASLAAVAVMALSGATVASAQSTLETVKDRGHLRCQVGPPSPGYYNLDSNGDWDGLDVSICQAVAAAIFGDIDPPPLNWCILTVRKRRIKYGNQEAPARRGCNEAKTG